MASTASFCMRHGRKRRAFRSSVHSLLAACGMENERDVKVDFMALLRVLKLVDEVDARRSSLHLATWQ